MTLAGKKSKFPDKKTLRMLKQYENYRIAAKQIEHSPQDVVLQQLGCPTEARCLCRLARSIGFPE